MLDTGTMPSGVFIIRNGAWQLWCEFSGLINARQEATYLTDMLGITTKVFRRNKGV